MLVFNLIIVALLPLVFFFYLVVAAPVRHGQLMLRYKARLPEIVRVFVSMAPALAIFSPHVEAGEDSLLIFFSITVLGSAFALPLLLAPSSKDSSKKLLFAKKWAASKIEAIFYGVAIAYIFKTWVGAWSESKSLLDTLLSFVIDQSYYIDNDLRPGNSVVVLIMLCAVYRCIVASTRCESIKTSLSMKILVVLSTIVCVFLLLISLSLARFEFQNWIAPTGYFVAGVFLAFLADYTFAHDIERIREKHGKW